MIMMTIIVAQKAGIEPKERVQKDPIRGYFPSSVYLYSISMYTNTTTPLYNYTYTWFYFTLTHNVVYGSLDVIDPRPEVLKMKNDIIVAQSRNRTKRESSKGPYPGVLSQQRLYSN
jgi:hypothetical protein